MTATAGPPVTRADEIDTPGEAIRALARRPSARVIGAAVVALLAWRATLGGPVVGDAIVVGTTVMIAGPVEWVIHRHVLHAPTTSWTSRKLGTGIRHRRHHVDPPDLDHLLLRGPDAAVFVIVLGVLTAGWSVPLLRLVGAPVTAPFVSAWALAAAGLAHYEWVHLLVHTRHRCTTRYYSRLARNHRLHHFRNEHYWLGVTTNSGDRLLRTYPADRNDVPISDTARNPT